MEYVTSADGTRISYERSGNGPPLVLVHGSLNDRFGWTLVGAAFAEGHTVLNMDRRGRGESGPIADHDMERQFEDVVAVLQAAGEPVDLVGHSYGALCALGAAALAPHLVKHLALYEPPTPSPSSLPIVEAFGSADPGAALEQFMTQAIGESPERIAATRASGIWPYMLSFAATMPSEGRAVIAYGFDPHRYAHLRMPALFLVGSETEERLGDVLRQLRPVMPQAEWAVFEDQGHGAMGDAPKLFADTVLEFLSR